VIEAFLHMGIFIAPLKGTYSEATPSPAWQF